MYPEAGARQDFEHLYIEDRSIRKLSWPLLELPERSSGASRLHSMRNSSENSSSSQASVANGKPRWSACR
jgi:hypothetical protein